jgi:NAD(P)-dependent dehydrogenase (short-subunit alcohol dehydrogenase family)
MGGMLSLEGRRAVVTGGSQGMGRGVATMFARQGADVAVAYLGRADEAASAAEETAREIEAVGRRALLVEGDLTRREDVERLRDEAVGAFGRVDILVNNVGGFPSEPAPLVELTDDDWDRSIEFNLRSAFLCCSVFTPGMVAQNSGRIVNVSASLSSSVGVAACTHYGAAKAGLLTLTKALAREVAPAGVTVNAVAPGGIDTPMNRIGARRGWWSIEEEVAGIDLGRLGTVEDVAAAVTFFASDEAGWITGQTLHVNGGSHMQ